MRQFKAYLKQDGEGCDYSIGCGQIVISIIADNKNDAEAKLIDIIKEEYYGSNKLKFAELYEIESCYDIDTKAIYEKIDNDFNEKIKAEKEEFERKEFERLRAKFK